MIGSISGKIKAKAALMDPGHYGRSDTSAMGRWFWEIDKVLLLLLAVLIGIGLIAVAAASPAAASLTARSKVSHSATAMCGDKSEANNSPASPMV